MGSIMVCDFCGQSIEDRYDRRGYVELHPIGLRLRGGMVAGQVFVFHVGDFGDEESCWEKVSAVLQDHREQAVGRGTEPAEAAYDKERREWAGLPLAEKKHQLLNALGDDRLTRNKIRQRLQAAGVPVYQGETDRLVAKLLAQGELGRAQETRIPGGKALCWRYYRPGLTPEMAAIERQLEQG